MRHREDIVITGLGLVSNLGVTPQTTWEAIIAGRSALGPMRDLEQRPREDKGGGQAAPLPADYCSDFPRAARYLRFAVNSALRMSGLSTCAEARTGAVFGTTLHGMRAGGEFFRTGDPSRLSNFLAGSVLSGAIGDLGIGGPLITTCAACSSGLSAVGLALSLIRAGIADRMIVGGYDSVSEYAYAGFDSLRLISRGTVRPFASDRDGMKVAEGYGVLVLERGGHALARGADVLAVVAGYGESSDGFHLTQPHPEGLGAAEAIRTALAEAERTCEQIGMIAAHGTATPNNDAAEHAALRAVFGPGLSRVPVVALKSHLGHTLGGAGAVELVLSALACQNNQAPPTANTREPDEHFSDLALVREAPTPRIIEATANLSLGFGGANTCVVLRKKSGLHAPRDEESQGDGAEPVITGIGLILPGAVDLESLSRLRLAKTPVHSDTGPIPENVYSHLLSARRTRRMSDYVKLTLASTTAALRGAGIAEDAALLSGCSVLLGTTHGSTSFCEAYYRQIVHEGLEAANPVLFAEGVPNAAAAHISMAFGMKGGCQTIIGARCAGLSALALAALRIREGRWTCALVGAAEEYSAVVNSAYAACGLYGEKNGFVAGSGSVALVVESRRTAAARGAPVIGAIGAVSWLSGKGAGCAAGVARALPGQGDLMSCYTRAAPDRAAVSALRADARGRDISSISAFVPELFSVGPLAALIAVLAEPVSRRFTVVGSEYEGDACGIDFEQNRLGYTP